MNRGGRTTSSKTSKKKYTRKQIGGDIDELSHLVYYNISPFINDEPYRGIKPEWQKYIVIPPPSSEYPNARMSINPQPTELLKNLINGQNRRGQTLLNLASKNSNLQLYNLLIRFGANPKIKNNIDSSTVLHGIAWGNDDRPGGPPTYEEKLSMLQQIIGRVPELIFDINQNGETFYHNLMYKHPETIPPYTKLHICSSKN
jgi:ankyrin repeat protein